MTDEPSDARTARGDRQQPVPASAGADPQQVADLLRTFSSAPARRRRRSARRADAPDTIVPLIVAAAEPALDPGRIEAARDRLKAEAAARLAAAAAAAGGSGTAAERGPVDLGSFDAARERLRSPRHPPRDRD